MLKITLSAQNIVKRYGGVVALANGRLTIASGEVVALVGANGSGKSTLGKVITGVTSPDEGELLVDGQPMSFATPQAARKLGITAVYQELSLIPDMTVAENIWLAHEPRTRFGTVDSKKIRRETEALLALFAGTVQPTLTPDSLITDLPPDERQIVEILKALSQQPRCIILDEATASLDSQQVDRLFDLVDTWKADGMAIVIVSHRMDENYRVADRAVVLRGGDTVGEVVLAETTPDELVQLMIADAAVALKRTETAVSDNATTRLTIRDLTTDTLSQISLAVRDGELLGIGGLRGQGQEDLLLAIFGAIPFSGNVELAGTDVHFTHPRQAMAQEVAFVPGDRGTEGLMLSRSILENLHLPSWRRYGIPIKHEQGAACWNGRCETAQPRHGFAGCACEQPEWWQRAKGGAGQMAAARSEAAAAERPDERGRCGCQG